jgi:hypothetical protein
MRKAKAEARVRARTGAERVVSVADVVDPNSFKRPLKFDRVRIPESHLDPDDEDV